MTRRAARRLLQTLTGLLGLPLAALGEAVLRRTGRRAGVALIYHRVGDPPGDPDAELTPALGSGLFAAQLRNLRRRYRPVPAGRLRVAAGDRRPGERFPVSVTFDDDLSSHLESALPVLRAEGVPGSFFLCGASLDGPRSFWWERLERAVQSGMPPEAALGGDPGGPDTRPLHRVAAAIEALPSEERERLSEELLERAGPDPPDSGLRAPQVRELADAGQEIGFHTLRHDRLPELDDDSLDRALVDGRDRLAEAAGRPPTLVAYPHGAGDRRVADAAHRAGWAGGFTARPAAVTPESHPLLIGRVEAPLDSTGHLALRILRALAGL